MDEWLFWKKRNDEQQQQQGSVEMFCQNLSGFCCSLKGETKNGENNQNTEAFGGATWYMLDGATRSWQCRWNCFALQDEFYLFLFSFVNSVKILWSEGLVDSTAGNLERVWKEEHSLTHWEHQQIWSRKSLILEIFLHQTICFELRRRVRREISDVTNVNKAGHDIPPSEDHGLIFVPLLLLATLSCHTFSIPVQLHILVIQLNYPGGAGLFLFQVALYSLINSNRATK